MLQNLLPKNLPNLQNNQDLKKELNLITEKLTNDNFTLQQKNTILNRLIILTLFSSAGLLTLSYLNFNSQSQKNVLNERIQTINSKNESITLEINNLAEGSLKLAQYDNAEKNRVSRKEFFFFLSNISRILSNETIVRYDYKHDIGVTKFNIIYNSQNEKILNELQEYILRNGNVSNLKNTVVIVEGKTFQYSLTGDFNER